MNNKGNNQVGSIFLYYGGMYSGKSEKLIWKLKRFEIAGNNTLLFKPSIDNRYAIDKVVTHTKEYSYPAIKVSNSFEIFSHISKYEKENNLSVNTVGIDEVQFFDENIKSVVKELVKKGVNVVLSGLDMYSTEEPFPITAHFACVAKYPEKLHAVCMDCGEDAYISYKIGGMTENTVDIGSTGKYVALCADCKKIHDETKK